MWHYYVGPRRLVPLGPLSLNIATLTIPMEDEYERTRICGLSNGAISIDLEWPLKVTTFFNVK